jgi:hypothetical protein
MASRKLPAKTAGEILATIIPALRQGAAERVEFPPGRWPYSQARREMNHPSLSDQPTPTARTAKPLDIHVHMVGTGAGGTGCRLRLRVWQRAMSGFMLRGIGLPANAMRGDFDRLYVEQLVRWVRGSSLGAAVILAQDEVLDAEGRVLGGGGSHFVPNEYVIRLAREHEEFLPAVSIHPARPDALEELDRCLAAGAALMKCLPNCQNIDCADRRFTRFWERMAEARLPFLAHTGGEHTLPIVRREFADPRTLTRPLEIGVPVIAAHCAGKSGFTDPEYFPALVELMRKFPNCYTDTSALNIPLRSRLLRRCFEPAVAERLVHGSDYPVPISGAYAWLRGLVNWRTFRACAREPNPLERDYALKRAMGIDPAVFTRGWELLRLPARG